MKASLWTTERRASPPLHFMFETHGFQFNPCSEPFPPTSSLNPDNSTASSGPAPSREHVSNSRTGVPKRHSSASISPSFFHPHWLNFSRPANTFCTSGLPDSVESLQNSKQLARRGCRRTGSEFRDEDGGWSPYVLVWRVVICQSRYGRR